MKADPVCGKAVPRRSHTPRHVFEGQAYYFCSKACADRFAAQPARYVHGHRVPTRTPKSARG